MKQQQFSDRDTTVALTYVSFDQSIPFITFFRRLFKYKLPLPQTKQNSVIFFSIFSSISGVMQLHPSPCSIPTFLRDALCFRPVLILHEPGYFTHLLCAKERDTPPSVWFHPRLSLSVCYEAEGIKRDCVKTPCLIYSSTDSSSTLRVSILHYCSRYSFSVLPERLELECSDIKVNVTYAVTQKKSFRVFLLWQALHSFTHTGGSKLLVLVFFWWEQHFRICQLCLPSDFNRLEQYNFTCLVLFIFNVT